MTSFRISLYWALLGLVFLAMLNISCQTTQQADTSNADDLRPSQTKPPEAEQYIRVGDQHMAGGRPAKAIGYWRAALDHVDVQTDAALKARILLKMAKAYASMGQTTQALQNVDAAIEIVVGEQDQGLEIAALSLKGSIYLSVGEIDQARGVLEECILRARRSSDRQALAAALIDLGNLYAYRKRLVEAQKAYAEGIAIYERSPEAHLPLATALINSALAAIEAGRFEQARMVADRSRNVIARAADRHEKILVLINIALVFHRLRQHLPAQASGLLEQAHQTLLQAYEKADQLDDLHASSYALGHLGELYESEDRLEEALELSRRAAIAARKIDAKEALFRWQWQIGRIYRRQNQLENAITAYRLSVVTLNSIQQAQTGCYGRFQSTLRQDVTAVSVELADLLLRRAPSAVDAEIRQALLSEAREVVELSKVNELRDYYQDDCVDAASANITQLDTISTDAAIVYPLLLDDRLELLASTPAGLKQYRADLPVDEVIDAVHQFRRLLEKRTTREYLPWAQKLYDWLIRPIEKDMDPSGPKTLVFIPGGALRTIPMAALHDGRRFLVEKYALAVAPGLYLTDPQPLGGKKVEILAAGLTQSVQGFPSLPFVDDELKAIHDHYPATLMLNEDFSVAGIETALEDEKFTIVHIASHAEFGENIANTFLLAFDDKVSLDRLDQSVGLLKYREDPLELLTLSACETAAGDDRAALGLAGVAVKSGARSALATLWHVNDLATSILIGEFYLQLSTTGTTRAVALQRAQQKLLSDLRYQHPGYWSPYILINNWL
jgi:CHAT domain-containing protein